MSNYNIVAETAEYTVVSEYRPETRVGSGYQSEAELESGFIDLLRTQGYEYLPLHDEAALITNLRKQLEQLNGFAFSDAEWGRFSGVHRKQQRGHRGKDPEDSGRPRADPAPGRRFHQEHPDSSTRRTSTTTACRSSTSMMVPRNPESRYDVSILGSLPLVHAELKRRGVAIREALQPDQTSTSGTVLGGKRPVRVRAESSLSPTAPPPSTTPTPPGEPRQGKRRKRAQEKQKDQQQLRVHLLLGGREQQGHSRAGGLHLGVSGEAYPAERADKILRVHVRGPAARPAPLPDRGHRAHPLRIEISANYKKNGHHRGRRVHLAHHGQRPDAHVLQDSPDRIGAALHRQGAFRGGRKTWTT